MRIFVGFLLVAACTGDDSAATGATSWDASTAVDGGAFDGSAVQCAITPVGCACAPNMEAGTATCSVESVSASKPAEDQVSCCALGSSVCSCTGFGCRDYPSLGSCVCQSSVTTLGSVSACPSRSGTTCCFDDSGPMARCACSSSACAAGQRVVPSCSVADVAGCGPGTVATPACR